MLTRIVVAVVLIGINVSGVQCGDPPKPPAVTGNDPNPRWTAENAGTENFSAYVTKTEVPAGAEVRIRVVKVGGLANVKLEQWIGTNVTTQLIREWKSEAMAADQVLSHTLTKPARVAIEVGGQNYTRMTAGIKENGEFDTMSFQNQWVLDVKIIKPPF